MNLETLLRTVDACVAVQCNAVRDWHVAEPAQDLPVNATDLVSCVLSQHQRNFQLWHVEDSARRKDVDDTVIAECKRRIDTLNQQRNDGMERVDACLLGILEPLLPKNAADRINTEPPGMAIDRLSILSLKIWHMREQLERVDVSAEHIAACQAKVDLLIRQHANLVDALKDLLRDYVAGAKRPARYFQCKMYNDPSLNPQLYENKLQNRAQ